MIFSCQNALSTIEKQGHRERERGIQNFLKIIFPTEILKSRSISLEPIFTGENGLQRKINRIDILAILVEVIDFLSKKDNGGFEIFVYGNLENFSRIHILMLLNIVLILFQEIRQSSTDVI